MISTALAGPSASLSPEALVQRRFNRSMEVPTAFFEAQADRVAAACQAMAARFERGGRLLVTGTGAEASDARHVAVEFVHPVLVGKRALPALALGQDAAQQLSLIGAAEDIALVLGWSASPESHAALAQAHARGMLTVALTGGPRPPTSQDLAGTDFLFHVPSDDPLVVQETHETLYHVLWELVHLFFDGRAAS